MGQLRSLRYIKPNNISNLWTAGLGGWGGCLRENRLRHQLPVLQRVQAFVHRLLDVGLEDEEAV